MNTPTSHHTLRLGFVVALLWVSLTAGSQAQPTIIINEFMADNRSALENNGDFPDWVELYNVTGQPIDLGDWSLTDNFSEPRKFVFPAGAIVQPNAFLLVYCDDRTGSPGIHSGFSLDDKGETLALFDTIANGGVQRDSVVFGLQLADQSVGRFPDFVGDFTLNNPTPLGPNSPMTLGNPADLKINEWSALNGSSEDDPDPDWFELYNAGPLPVSLGGLVFTDQTIVPATNQAVASLSFIAGGGFIQFFADDEVSPADNVGFKLGSSNGDRILLYWPDRTTLIDSVTFEPQTLNISQGRLPDGSASIVSFQTNQPTPGASNFLPLTNVVINEVLTHTDPPLEDAIELLNVSDSAVDISGWWLSNSKDDPKKFRIPDGTVLQPGGFVVFYEGIGSSAGFNTSGVGASPDFTLNSAHGDQVYLLSADLSGTLTGYRSSVDFGAAENGVSFGRYVTSTGKADLTAMSQRTFGADNPSTVDQFRTGTGLPNAAPKIAPVVISEIMYHPPDIIAGTETLDNTRDEFIELCNSAQEPVSLFDPLFPTNTWRIRGGVDFDFPENQTLAAGQCLLVVNFSPSDVVLLEEFRGRFDVPPSVPVYGPYQGKLNNGGATVELQKPDFPQLPPHPDAGFVPHIAVDRVKYSDTAPWPASPDGTGDSLQRCRLEEYGNDPINWVGARPGAGLPATGVTIGSIQRSGDMLALCFDACGGRTYSVQSSPSLSGSGWTKVTDVTNTTSSLQCVNVPMSSADETRFFRIVTPAQP